MSIPLQNLDELCPNCGNFVDHINELTGFCELCSNGVGVFLEKVPTPTDKQIRLELWLSENADTIENVMLAENMGAKDAIRQIAQRERPRCRICNDEMPHTTQGRHFFCTKREQCRRARRYYRYLVYEKQVRKEQALDKTLERFEK